MVPNFHQNTMFLDKADYFSNKSLDAYKNADANSNFHMTK